MPSTQELQQRLLDEKRVKAENQKAIAAQRDLLKKRQAEITQRKADLEREAREIASELSALA